MKWFLSGDIAETEDKRMSSVNIRRRECIYPYAKAICDLVVKENPRSILILGLSLGCMVAELSRRTTAQITGVDIDPESVQFVKAMNPNARIIRGDASQLQIGHFDVIISDIFSDDGPLFSVDPEYVKKLRSKCNLYVQNVLFGIKDLKEMEGWDEIYNVGGNTLFVARNDAFRLV